VRPIIWNPELPWLLISGSWDSTIKMWDVRQNSCIYTAYEHYADIYGLDIHPERPFNVISCSRDSSIRTWSLLNMANKMLLQGICSDNL